MEQALAASSALEEEHQAREHLRAVTLDVNLELQGLLGIATALVVIAPLASELDGALLLRMFSTGKGPFTA